MIRSIFLFITVLAVSGCTLFQPQVRPDAPIDLPEHYSLYSADEPGPGRWWEAFGSDELNRLVDTALAGNFDVRTAWAKLRQADAVLRQAGADLLPTLDADAGAEKSWTQTKTDSSSRTHTDSKTFSAGLSAAYELDLWGRLGSLRESEALEYEAVREDLDAAAVTVSAEVVTAWIDILSLRRQIDILNEQIDLNQRMLNLQVLRFANGQSDALEVAQQKEALAAAKANLPPLKLDEQIQRHALAVLLGLASSKDLPVSQSTLPELITLPAAGVPADILAARPDVRAAGLRLKSADWQVSAARADRLPSLTLSADAVFSSDSLDLLFSNWVATLAASITGPIFDGGYRAAEVDKTRAEAEEALTGYAQTVAEAIQEVEDSLATETRQAEYITLLEEELEASRTSMKASRLQYLNGQANYLDYLSAWTSVQSLERQLVDEKATRIKNRVTLYRTLGGDWTRNLAGDA
ncbi:TolC family protein [uncultured Desulfosarcina sp.]|uniref:TolC family protein n=1 Tax=uncultured Desulfosarcina sp. TaxID=218289 RepID=UPI0029C6A2DD|nr:TolC family protein [uncultured Desulfosarcina sp.]